MVDAINLSATVNIRPPKHLPGLFRWKTLVFSAEYKRGEFQYYKAEFRNLRLKLKGDTLTVSNSLHVFYSGNNYSDFTFKELSNAIDVLCRFFELEPSMFRVLSLEFGINLTFHKIVTDAWQNVAGYKMKQTSPMKLRGATYGVKIDLTEFALKLYNKSHEQYFHYGNRLGRNIFRVEIQIKKMRLIPFINSLEDLLRLENINALFDLLLVKLTPLEYFPPSYFVKELSCEQRQFLFAGFCREYWRNEEIIDKKSFLKGRKRFSRLKNSIEQFFDLKGELVSKFCLLID